MTATRSAAEQPELASRFRRTDVRFAAILSDSAGGASAAVEEMGRSDDGAYWS